MQVLCVLQDIGPECPFNNRMRNIKDLTELVKQKKLEEVCFPCVSPPLTLTPPPPTHPSPPAPLTVELQTASLMRDQKVTCLRSFGPFAPCFRLFRIVLYIIINMYVFFIVVLLERLYCKDATILCIYRIATSSEVHIFWFPRVSCTDKILYKMSFVVVIFSLTEFAVVFRMHLRRCGWPSVIWFSLKLMLTADIRPSDFFSLSSRDR